MATLGVYRKLSPTVLPLFPPPGVTAQVHWVLAGTLLSGKCAAEYLVHLHPLLVESPGVKRICDKYTTLNKALCYKHKFH